jgi:hypothetical protein
MTRFITYDPDVAARIGAAVGMHRVDLRDAAAFPGKTNPAILDLINSPHHNAALMPSRDEQVLVVRVHDEQQNQAAAKKRRKKLGEHEIKELGSQPSGFLGLQDEAVFVDDEEETPRSLWKKEEE